MIKKRLLCMICIICMIVQMIPVSSYAQTEAETDTNEIVYAETEATVYAASETELPNATFSVNKTSYSDLTAAINAANSGSVKTIVLTNDGILPAGDYTIPSGVTLLIPYDEANTLCTTAPTTSDSSSTLTAYRTLTMANGANITVDGAISLSATQYSGSAKSSPTGPCSFIQMNSGSNITVNSGGKLYAWGYIQGSGSVTVESGGTVYECFQIMDWRGGDNTKRMIGNDYKVFPMSQYYIQNIEVPMTLKAGATENGYMSVNVTVVGIQKTTVPFIGSNGMFNITSGYVVKDYDETTGRLLIDTYGEIEVKNLSISIKVTLFYSANIDSSDYVLPFNGNMTLTLHSGSNVTVNQDLALLPGTKFIIDEGATCTLGSGNNIYVYDYDEWILDSGDTYDEGKSFCGTGDKTHVNLSYPSSAKDVSGRTDDAYVEVNGTADFSAGYIYTTKSGACITGTGTITMKPGTADKTYQVKCLGSNSKTLTYYGIDITSAKLQNADGSYVETAGASGTTTYTYYHNQWNVGDNSGHSTVKLSGKAATCTETGLTEGSKCECDNFVYVEQTVIPVLGHSYSSVVTAATCTADGYTTYTCSRCNDTYKSDTTTALGHTAGAAATCTTAQTCTVCGATLNTELGHKEVIDAKVEPTCTETGLTEGKHCSVCGTVTVAQTVVDALGHKFDNDTDKECNYCNYVRCSIISYLNDDEITVQLLTADGQVVYRTIVSTSTERNESNKEYYSTYSILGVADGTYILRISKANHVSRDYEVIVSDGTIAHDAKIHLIGDINGDGSVGNEDIELAKDHYKNKVLLSGYDLQCADVTKDGNVNIIDINKMNLHFKNKSNLW